MRGTLAQLIANQDQIAEFGQHVSAESKERATAITTGVNKKVMDTLKAQFLALNGAVAREMAARRTASEELYANARQILIAVVVTALLVAAVTGFWMALSISRGLGQAVRLADGVAMGDLDRRVSVRSNDEVKDLVDALNRMTENLRATASVAGAIAQGNLAVEVKPLSDKDTLGLALQDMVEKLRAIASNALAASDNVSAGSEELAASAEEMSRRRHGAGSRSATGFGLH